MDHQTHSTNGNIMTAGDDQNIHDDDDDAEEDAEDDLNALNDWANGVAEGATSARVLIHLQKYHHHGHQNEMSPPRFDMFRVLIFLNCVYFCSFGSKITSSGIKREMG